MLHSRRTVLSGLGTLGLLGGGLIAAPALAQRATLSTLVFISKRLDASTADYRKWYIEHHAPDFLSFARPTSCAIRRISLKMPIWATSISTVFPSSSI